MLYPEMFRQPVSILEPYETPRNILIHRRVPCEHLDGPHCPCSPWAYRESDLWQEGFLETLNARLASELQ